MPAADEPLDLQGQGVLDAQSGLTKVVLARRSDVAFRGTLDPLSLLAALQVPIVETFLLHHLFRLSKLRMGIELLHRMGPQVYSNGPFYKCQQSSVRPVCSF